MVTRTARTAWSGTLAEGSGDVEHVSSGLATFHVSWPKRASEHADRATSPEELIAAAHSSCFAMQFSALLGQAGGNPRALEVTADVGFGPDPDGGFHLTGIRLTVRGDVEGVDAETFARVAGDAKETCPVSKALRGVAITLDAALV
jgi:osmotically inducible protein OsmC